MRGNEDKTRQPAATDEHSVPSVKWNPSGRTESPPVFDPGWWARIIFRALKSLGCFIWKISHFFAAWGLSKGNRCFMNCCTADLPVWFTTQSGTCESIRINKSPPGDHKWGNVYVNALALRPKHLRILNQPLGLPAKMTVQADLRLMTYKLRGRTLKESF